MASVITLGRAVVEVYGDWSRFHNGAATAADGLIKNMSRVGRAMTYAISLPLGVAGAAIINTAADFEYALDRTAILIGKTGGLTEATLAQLNAKAQELGRTTVYTATEAAEGMQFLALTGLDTNEILQAITPSLYLAAAGELELARSADIVTNIMTAFGKEASDVDHITNVLAETMSSSNTNIEQLADAMKYVGPVASYAGLELEEVAATIGMLGNAGLQASTAGTGLRNIITRLAAPTAKTKKILSNYGIEVFNADGKMRSLVDIIRQFEEAGLSVGEVFDLFKQRGSPAFGALISQGETGSEVLEEFTNRLVNVGDRAKEIADAQLDNLRGAFMLLKAAGEGLAIAIGEAGLLNDVRGVVERFTDLINRISTLNPMILKAGTYFATFLIAIFPVMWAAGTLVTLFGTMVAIIPSMIAGFAGIAAVAAGIYIGFQWMVDWVTKAREQSFEFRYGWDNALRGIQGVIDEIKESLGLLWGAFQQGDTVEEGLRNVWAGLTTHSDFIFDGLGEAFEEAFDRLWEWLSGPGIEVIASGIIAGKAKLLESGAELLDEIITGIEDNLPAIETWFETVFLPAIGTAIENGVPILVESLGNTMTLVLSNVATIITGDSSIGDAVEQTLSGITDKATDLATNLTSGLGGEGGGMSGLIDNLKPVVDFFQGAFAYAIEWAIQLWNDLQPRIQGVVQAFKDFWAAAQPLVSILADVLGPVLAFIGRLILQSIGSAIDAVLMTIQYFVTFLTGVINVVRGIFGGGWSQIWTGIQQIFSGAIGAIIGMVRLWIEVGFLKIFSRGFALVKGIVSGGFNFVRNLFTGGFNFIRNVATKGITGVWRIINTVLTRVWNFIRGILGKIRSYFTTAINGVRTGAVSGLTRMQKSIGNIINNVLGVFRRIWGQITTFVRGAAMNIRQAVVGPISQLPGRVMSALRNIWSNFTTMLGRIRNIVSSSGTNISRSFSRFTSSIVSTARSLPGKILRFFTSLPGRLFSMLKTAGSKVIGGLVSGITGNIGKVTGAITNVVSSITDRLPFSPAKKGPLSGRGDPTKAGRRITNMLAKGIAAEVGSIENAANLIAGGILPSGGGSIPVGLRAYAGPRPRGGDGSQAVPDIRDIVASRSSNGPTLVQNFHGPQTGDEVLREAEWGLRSR